MFSITFHDLTDGEPDDDAGVRGTHGLHLLFNMQLDSALVRALAHEALLHDQDTQTPFVPPQPKHH